jgi:chitinase
MPAPSDVQTANGGSTVGRPETRDRIVFTFTGPVDPTLISAGWDGSAKTVAAYFQHRGGSNTFTVQDDGVTLAALGSVELGANYASNVTFSNSTMTLSGSTVTVVLDDGSGGIHTVSTPTTMVWTTPQGSVPESGPADVHF